MAISDVARNEGITNSTVPKFNATEVLVAVNNNSSEIIIWGFVCACVTLFGLGLATCKYFRDKYEKPENKRKRKEKSDHEKREKEEKAVEAVKKDPILKEQFLQRLKQKKSDKHLNIEVRAIVRNQDEFSCTVAMTPENILRNVNQDVVSYDHTRVVLEDMPDDEGDYINASFIDGYLREKEYIATQGPRQKTVASFWHMIWQEGVHCIVMATGLFENASQQCDKYWGDVFSMHKYVRHGDIHVWLDSTMEIAQLTVRSFRIQKDGEYEERHVKHFEMVGFNDEDTDPGFILDCIRRVNAYMLKSSGPILVHCRCGGGKTAVYIAIDYCLKQLEGEGYIDVYSSVLHMRKFRKNMVRTLYQYRLIYESIAMHIQCGGTTVIPSAQLPAEAQRLSLDGFEKKFQVLRSIVPKLSIGDCAGGHRSENRNKSRDIMLLPPERARPYLLTMESSDSGTDFINAVFVDGYYQLNNFLVTQWPMQHTINDVWRLVFDNKIHSLVLLNDTKYCRNFPCFWPRELDVEQKYGPIGVKYLGCQKYPHIVIRAFAVRKLPNQQYDSILNQLGNDTLNLSVLPVGDIVNDYMILKIFQLTSWPGKEKTQFSTKSLIYLMGCVEEWQQKTNPHNPVCVMSKDGYSRVGVYCVTNICCDQLKAEGEVDVFNAVRLVKKNRVELVPNVMEYIYCYSFLVAVLSILQEDTPKIVITGPASKDGQVNRGYISGYHPGPLEHVSDLSKVSEWSFHTAYDTSPSLSGATCLAARGHIAKTKSPLHQLKPPHVDNTSSSSIESLYDIDPSKQSFLKVPWPDGDVANDARPPSPEENNNHVTPHTAKNSHSNNNSVSGLQRPNYLQTSSFSAFYTPSNSSRSVSSNSDMYHSTDTTNMQKTQSSVTRKDSITINNEKASNGSRIARKSSLNMETPQCKNNSNKQKTPSPTAAKDFAPFNTSISNASSVARSSSASFEMYHRKDSLNKQKTPSPTTTKDFVPTHKASASNGSSIGKSSSTNFDMYLRRDSSQKQKTPSPTSAKEFLTAPGIRNGGIQNGSSYSSDNKNLLGNKLGNEGAETKVKSPPLRTGRMRPALIRQNATETMEMSTLEPKDPNVSLSSEMSHL